MSREGTIRADHVWKGFSPDRGRPLLRDRIELIRSRLVNKSEKGWQLGPARRRPGCRAR